MEYHRRNLRLAITAVEDAAEVTQKAANTLTSQFSDRSLVPEVYALHGSIELLQSLIDDLKTAADYYTAA
ncbi:hypothetical protein [Microbulbifer sp. ALW1]|uniref:hypothetical protein n=1 Tax=Microbulbifer sp. (strain ALW1) TaxID=1516059 RepID=UPI00135A2A2D|nr:hypothetical protein [Microbulbifer sp. ALW1]